MFSREKIRVSKTNQIALTSKKWRDNCQTKPNGFKECILWRMNTGYFLNTYILLY